MLGLICVGLVYQMRLVSKKKNPLKIQRVLVKYIFDGVSPHTPNSQIGEKSFVIKESLHTGGFLFLLIFILLVVLVYAESAIFILFL